MGIRIALADDQALVREGFKALLTHLGMHVVVEASDGAMLLQQLEGISVDVVVSDIRMPKLDGVAMVRTLRASGNATPVVLLTTFEDSRLMLDAIEAGAQGFLLKGASAEDLRTAIEQVAEGNNWLAPISTTISMGTRAAPARGDFITETFSDRELAILRLLAGGYSNKEIARSLGLADGTIKNYVSDILAKLGTRDRTRAVLKAITCRLI